MIITKAFLEKHGACADAYDWYLEQKTTDGDKLFKAAMKAKMYNEIWWTLRRKLNKKQSVKIAIYAAEQVIDIFEKKYPNDIRPRKAIQAVKKYLKNPTDKAFSHVLQSAVAAHAAAASARNPAAIYASCAAASVIGDIYGDPINHADHAALIAPTRGLYKTNKIKILRYAWRVLNDNA